ncbi:sodium channel modifier 1-like [Panicum miliaceum]|uniref:Sodium channel modifier 1 n=1 Tax=Panicum miliaceum TaxID=4540 RepID=A0A3L6RIR9_PANMI|nr:sodium channel modifier 1-like [Panicum miliaceum]
MSVFGGDSWARDAEQRKRRLDDLILPAPASSSLSTPESFRRLPNGKLACLVCPHRPVLDSPLMLSMHNKGARHIAAESRLREKELSKKHEINKRLALSSDASHSNSANPHFSSKLTNMKEKPLIEQTRRAILEAQSSRFHDFNGKKVSHDLKWTTNTSSSDPHVAPSDVPMEKLTGNTGSIQCNSSKGESFAGNQIQGKLLSDWQTEAQKCQEQELRFTAMGWKRDGHGRWYRDENVEFDSDEDDPNICLR